MIDLKLDKLLTKEKLTILQLSEETGISRSTLNSMVNGSTKGIQFTTLDTLCNFFRCDVNDLIEFTPTVEMPELHSIAVGKVTDNVYSVLFIYTYTDKNGLKEIGLSLDIEITKASHATKIVFSAMIASQPTINDVLNRPSFTKKREPKEVRALTREYEKKILPTLDKERLNSVVRHYNLAVENWDELENELKSIKNHVTFSYSMNIPITNFFEVPYVTDLIYNDVSTNNENLINQILEEKDQLIQYQTSKVTVTCSISKNNVSESPFINKDDELNIRTKFWPVRKFRDDIQYKTIKQF